MKTLMNLFAIFFFGVTLGLVGCDTQEKSTPPVFYAEDATMRTLNLTAVDSLVRLQFLEPIAGNLSQRRVLVVVPRQITRECVMNPGDPDSHCYDYCMMWGSCYGWDSGQYEACYDFCDGGFRYAL